MFEFFKPIWRRFYTFLRYLGHALGLSNQAFATISTADKRQWVRAVLQNQDVISGTGLALRFVGTLPLLADNVKGFRGDAVSLAVTKQVLSAVLNKELSRVSQYSDPNDNQICFAITDNAGCRAFISLSDDLLVQIFDTLYSQLLAFITQCFEREEDSNHFMLITNMQGATTPYDCGSYPGGKCGKKDVEASQIACIVAQTRQVNEPHLIASQLIKDALAQLNAPKHHYSPESTRAILQVLNAINLTADEAALTEADVSERLVDKELQLPAQQASSFFEQYKGDNGYFGEFASRLDDVNDDLVYFRQQMNRKSV